MLSPDGEMIMMSFWNSAAPAEACAREGYPQVLAATEPFIDSTPVLSTYELVFSSAHQAVRSTAGA